MSRFWLTSCLAIPLFFCIGYFTTGWPRIWAFTGFWVVYLSILGVGVAFIQLQFFCPAICRVKPGRMRIALTFDDGPDPIATPALLDLLKKEEVRATFFCIGKHVMAHPKLSARIRDEGHLLGNHTFSHAWWTPLLGRRALTDELSRTQEQITAATGIIPMFMRPPVGLTNPHYARVLKRMDLRMIGWDVRSLDRSGSPAEVIARVLRITSDGSIILLHDGGSPPDRLLEIVGRIIPELRARGFEFERHDCLIAPDEV